MLVVDCSVAVKWLFDEDGTETARLLLAGDRLLAAPDLLIPEFTNTAWRLVRSGKAGEDHARAAVASLPTLFGRFHSARELAADAMELALRLGHPAYDCFYLALARDLGCRMVTADRKLVGRVEGTELGDLVEVLGE